MRLEPTQAEPPREPPPRLWAVAGRCADPHPVDWPQDLVRRLGQRPRRLGRWAERALHGALCCLESAGERVLPADAALLVCSLDGAQPALRSALTAVAQGQLPLPYTFLQSQAAVMLSALAAHLGWSGDAQAVARRDPIALLHTSLLDAPPGGLLIGWVEDGPHAAKGSTAPRSWHHHWLRLRLADPASLPMPLDQVPRCRDLRPADLWSQGLTHLRI
jgi:hypothetical protein